MKGNEDLDALLAVAERIQELAFKIRPPNSVVPELMTFATGVQHYVMRTKAERSQTVGDTSADGSR